jgi:glycine/serine hydroxymethyltransferase
MLKEPRIMSVAERLQAQSNEFFAAPLSVGDPEIAEAIGKRLCRQHDEIELIALENIVSRAVLEAASRQCRARVIAFS